jgi:hypothetical protein
MFMKTQNIFRVAITTITLSLFIHFTLFPQQAEYSIRRIDEPVGGSGSSSGASRGGLNDSSVVLGAGKRGPFIWKDSLVTILPVEAGCIAWAPEDLNNQGVAVGWIVNSDYRARAYRWADGGYFDLGSLLLNCTSAAAFGINSNGRITGAVTLGEPTNETSGYIYDGSMNLLHFNGTGRSINDSNYVIGSYYPEPGVERGCRYGNGRFSELLGFDRATDINNRNQIVGINWNTQAALLWENGNVTTLWNGEALSINDSGTVVGCFSYAVGRGAAARWKNGTLSALQSLIPQNSDLVLEWALKINNKGEILCEGYEPASEDYGTATHYYYLLTPNTARIRRPRKDDTWISCEQDTIRWTGTNKGVSLIIDFSSDDGQTYQAVARNIPADSGKYLWDIPKDILSTKCFIRLRDNNTKDSLAVSEKFKIKPYIITKIDTTTGDYISYNINKDRWGFGNFPNDMWPQQWYNQFNYHGTDPFTGLQYSQDAPYVFLTAQSKDFTDWVSFVNAFGQNACYYLGINYKPEAVLHWAAKKRKWGGSCFAIAGANALAFEKKDEFRTKFSNFPNFDTPISVNSEPGVIKSITELYAQVYGNPTRMHEDNNCLKKTPNQTLNELKEILKTDNTEIRTLSFWHKDSSWGHTVLPYKIERSTIANTNWLVWVWDNSYPNDVTAFIYIDTSGNNNNGTWYCDNWLGWGGPGKLILELESSTYLGTATLPKEKSLSSPFIISDEVLNITTTYDADIQIMDDQGNITGYANSKLSYEIPGSVPLIFPTGGKSPPYGYHLQTGDYSVALNNFTADTIDTYFFTGNKIFSYGRYGATQTQTDRLFFDGGVSVTNPDTEKKSINLLSLSNDTTNQKLTLIRSIDLAKNDSIKLDNLEGSKYKLTSFGTEKTYSLEIQNVSESGLVQFKKSDVTLGSNTSHTIEPDWENVRDSLLTIVIDAGNDGRIDDTLKLQNELTDIHDHGSLIPREYKLYQNYPNPFNPLTTIEYSIPEQSYITLKVFDILGREVATLVNEEKKAGIYEVEFSAKGGSASGGNANNLPSGIYFYQIKTGSFIQTRKMLLLK